MVTTLSFLPKNTKLSLPTKTNYDHVNKKNQQMIEFLTFGELEGYVILSLLYSIEFFDIGISLSH